MRALKALAVLVLAAMCAAVVVALVANADVARRRAELAAESRVVETRSGPMQFTEWGEGPAILVLHGAGGGFDQGRLIANELGGDGFHWIAPSRFGYLASPLPGDASTAAQADALVDLLDHLHIARVTVMGFSGGTPPALQFAARHPERTAGLALFSSAPFTPHGAEVAARPIPNWLYQALFGNDAIYWTLSKTNRSMLENAFDARPELRVGLPADEARFVDQVVDAFLPASDRLVGVMNEGAAIDPSATYDLEDIRAPTLVVHARDDHINPFAIAEDIAARVSNAEFAPLDRGGHLLLGSHAALRARLSAFVAATQEEDRPLSAPAH